jgi:hypothetical protein
MNGDTDSGRKLRSAMSMVIDQNRAYEELKSDCSEMSMRPVSYQGQSEDVMA